MKRSQAILWSLVCAGAMATAAVHAQEWNSCERFAGYSSGPYSVQTDEWGATSGQCLHVYSATRWTSTSRFSGKGVKAYPHTMLRLNNADLDVLRSVQTSFDFSAPRDAVYDFAYDLWTANNQDEVMVWEKWKRSGPIASRYGCIEYPATACPIATQVKIGDGYYDVFQGSNGRNNVISFLRTAQRSRGTEDVLAFMDWCARRGKLHQTRFSLADFGVEITSTRGRQDFTLNSFSASVVSNPDLAKGNVAAEVQLHAMRRILRWLDRGA